MDRKNKVGKCHLCGEIGKLSLEHVPPQKAFNSAKNKLFGGEQLIGRDSLPWDFENLKAEHHQNGIGGNTLCVKCNSDTGGWYAKSYIDFVQKGYDELAKNRPTINASAVINFRDVYPLRVTKQILVMFMSINNEDFLDKQSELQNLLISKTANGIDTNKYALGIYVNASKLAKYVGLSCIMIGGKATIISEFSSIPFGFVLLFDPLHQEDLKRYCIITDLMNKFKYDDKTDLELTLPVYDSNIVIPGDYRTKDQILIDREKNIKKLKNENN